MLVLTSTPTNVIIITLPDGRTIKLYGPVNDYVKIGIEADRDIQIHREDRTK